MPLTAFYKIYKIYKIKQDLHVNPEESKSCLKLFFLRLSLLCAKIASAFERALPFDSLPDEFLRFTSHY